MRHTITLAVLAVWPALARAQAPADSARLLADIRETFRSYQEDAKNRTAELARKVGVLRTLADAAASISTFPTSASFSKAHGKFDDAQRSAQAEPPLPEPVPSVLGAISQLINQPGLAPPEQIRAKVFVALSRLEVDVLQQTAAMENEARVLQGIENSLFQARMGLGFAASGGVGAAIYVRQFAVR